MTTQLSHSSQSSWGGNLLTEFWGSSLKGDNMDQRRTRNVDAFPAIVKKKNPLIISRVQLPNLEGLEQNKNGEPSIFKIMKNFKMVTAEVELTMEPFTAQDPERRPMLSVPWRCPCPLDMIRLTTDGECTEVTGLIQSLDKNLSLHNQSSLKQNSFFVLSPIF